ncbi:hypothetical protein M6G63_18670 [Pseudomonas sp. BYT-5]|uniref:hypothetical protein n=1 Tax=Pseudomonas TaxID=286 RepID=UPI0020207D96|nr:MULTISPECIES: hypothetical protein [unclassified Pseudomonas]URD41449.1 hypothetical protein M6G63_18670 [Pseudomonas sp. BYT-5]URK96800.1 hypothetical protein J5X93_19335 [Pseudomonas sp. BYT-1]
MKSAEQSRLKYLLSSRPLIVKREGMHVCLHDAFSGEVLAGQTKVQLIQEPGEVTRLVVEFNCDGEYVRLQGE